MNVYIGGPVVISDMQGPASSGFHVPLSTEWQAIYDAYTGLGLSGDTNFSTYLKLPAAGSRNYSNLSLSNRGSSGLYWSSSPYSQNDAYYLSFFGGKVVPQNNYNRSNGYPIRCLKNSAVVPTASWTKLYGTSIESGGIFHNATDGLISISSDGSIWYTLIDKNLGATTVYNYGDTLTEANCGKVYQWGNNYAFSGDVNYDVSQISQSSTKVDVTGYGPGNYYNSSTWITTNPRQSSANNGNNLRGGVSQGSTTKDVELKNAYIGEVINISSDLRGATLAGLQAQGWDNIYCVVQGGGSGNYTLDSNGLSIHGTTNLYAILYKNIPDLSDTATVDLHITGYTTRVSSGYSYEYNTWVGCGLSPVASEYYNGIYGGYLSGNTNTPHGYTGITYKRGLLGNTSYTNVAGNFDITIKINLASGLVNYQITSPVSLTSNYTLNSTQLSDVRSMKYINIPLRLYVGDNTLRLYTVELTVS